MELGGLLGLFSYGAVTFITPCSISLVAVYLTYLLGVGDDRRKGITVGLIFLIAMTSTFFVLGVLIASLVPVDLNSKTPYLIASILLILFGLNSLGVLEKIPILSSLLNRFTEASNKSKTTVASKVLRGNYIVASFALGFIISVAISPCSLAGVLPVVMASLFSSSSPLYAGLMLAAFGLGHATPVFALSIVFASTRSRLANTLGKFGNAFSKILGIIFILLAIYLLAVNFL
jgi:cytochrome c biogenesis protein CcdA